MKFNSQKEGQTVQSHKHLPDKHKALSFGSWYQKKRGLVRTWPQGLGGNLLMRALVRMSD